MKRIHIILIILINIALVQLILGIATTYYGIVYKEIEMEKAEEMIEFVRTYNPEYYEKLTNGQDITYLREFYDNYTVRGNISMKIAGIIQILVAINSAITLFLIFIILKESFPQSLEQEETESVEQATEEEEKTAETSEAE